MIDPELEAIFKCTELLKELDDEAKIRVLQYLINRYKLTPGHQTSFHPNGSTAPSPTGQLPVGRTIDTPAAKATFSGSHPAIKDIVAKDLPKSEPEWVLIYCYYASDFGEHMFTREDIIAIYEESKRWTLVRNKNLSANIAAAVKKDWIKSINTSDFTILEEGRQYAEDILSGNSVTKPRKSSGKKREKKEAVSPSEVS